MALSEENMLNPFISEKEYDAPVHISLQDILPDELKRVGKRVFVTNVMPIQQPVACPSDAAANMAVGDIDDKSAGGQTISQYEANPV